MSHDMSGLQFAQAGEAAEHTETATTHAEGAKLPPFLQFDPGVWIWTILVFVVLLLILRKMAWKPIIASIEERDKTIKASLDQAARIQEEGKRLTEEQNKILAAARSEANTMLQSSRQAADELRRKLEQSAQEEKTRILASAQTEIDASTRAAMAELRRTTAELSIQIAEKLIQSNLDDTKQRTLVDKLINEVSAN